MIKKTPLIFIAFILLANASTMNAQRKIVFSSGDGLPVTADLYLVHDTLPYMILLHQAGYSRGEYRETARKFNKFNYNCLAVDARSGEEVNDVKNETATLAIKLNKPVNYLDAEQDILAAIDHVVKKSNQKIILVGSSYSASLALKIAANNNNVKDHIKAVIAFSPGEYFSDKLNLKESIKNLDKPIFATSTKDEAPAVTNLIKDIKSTKKQQFIPIEQGLHGSKTLWKSTPNHSEYWLQLFMFMREIKR